MPVHIKRVYEPAEASDGLRVLVDRLWPRGVSKDAAAIDEWRKDVAPSTGLRQWFGHDPGRFGEFAERYAVELEGSPALASLRELCQGTGTVTLVYAAKDPDHNGARVLLALIEG